MPSVNITSYSTTSVTATLTLSSYWTSANYQYAYITCNGQTSASIYPPTSGTSYTTGSITRSGTYTAGTTFTVYGYVVAKNGTTYSAGSATFNNPIPTLPTPSISSTSSGSTTVTGYITGSGSSVTYNLSVYKGGSYISSTTRTGAGYFTFFDLNPSTTYAVYGYASYSGYNNSATTGVNITTTAMPKLTTPTITNTSSGSSTVTGYVSGSSGASNYALSLYQGTTPIATQNLSSANYFTFSNLSPSTTYSVYAVASGPGYVNSDTGGANITTQALPKLATPTINSSLTIKTSTSIHFHISSANATWYYASCYLGTTLIGSSNNSTGEFTFSSLSASTEYTFYFYATASGYTNSDTGAAYATTEAAPQLPSPTLDTTATVKTQTTLQFTINAVTGYGTITYYAALFNEAGTTQIGSTQSGTGRVFSFTGLTKETTYMVKIKVAASGYSDSNWSNYLATTLGLYWEWSNAKTSAGTFNVTPTEWLAFYTRINEVRVKCGLSNYAFQTGAEYFGTGKPFYYWMMRQPATAIDEINGQVTDSIKSVNSGDPIYASYFENLKTALNNAIAAL